MLHHAGVDSCSCTCLAVNRFSNEVATAGEDGCINILAPGQNDPLKTIGKSLAQSNSIIL